MCSGKRSVRRLYGRGVGDFTGGKVYRNLLDGAPAQSTPATSDAKRAFRDRTIRNRRGIFEGLVDGDSKFCFRARLFRCRSLSISDRLIRAQIPRVMRATLNLQPIDRVNFHVRCVSDLSGSFAARSINDDFRLGTARMVGAPIVIFTSR